MEKLSVIIPTVLKNETVLTKLLNILNKDKVVDEIILINNCTDHEYSNAKDFDKISVYNQKENLYVNPSWNLGINLIKNDRFLIINDDILGPENFCSMVIESGILEHAETGLVGLCIQNIANYDRFSVTDMDVPVTENRPKFIPLKGYLYTGNWASAFFGKKENYHEIPDLFKIIYGDNYLIKANLDKNKVNYQICGLPFNHIASLSSGSMGEHQRSIDIKNAIKYFKLDKPQYNSTNNDDEKKIEVDWENNTINIIAKSEIINLKINLDEKTDIIIAD